MLIDIFRFCIRNDISLSKLIGKSVSKLVPTSQDNRQQIVDASSTEDTMLPSNTMDVEEVITRMQWLLRKKKTH